MGLREDWYESFAARADAHGRVAIADPASLPPELLDAWTPLGMTMLVRPGSGVQLLDGEHFRLKLVGWASYPGPSENGEIERVIDTRLGEVEHRRFFLPTVRLGRGAGRRMMARSIAIYGELGLERVETEAFNIGKYAWARCGYAFRDEQQAAIVNRVTTDLACRLGLLDDDDAFAFPDPWDFAALDTDDAGEPQYVELPDLARAIGEGDIARAGLRHEERIAVSKALLLFADYTRWFGTFWLSGPRSAGCLETMERYTMGAE